VVGSNSAQVSGTFALRMSLQPPAANASCTAPLAVADNSLLRGQNLALGRDAAGGCLPGADGPTLYYSATVLPGQTLSAFAQPTSYTGPWYPVLRILPAC